MDSNANQENIVEIQDEKKAYNLDIENENIRWRCKDQLYRFLRSVLWTFPLMAAFTMTLLFVIT